MPGFSGVIGAIKPALARAKLESMRDSMWLESFYNVGGYSDENEGVYLAWSCIKDSLSDGMPIFNEAKDKLLIFSGENFADRESVEELRGRRHNFDRNNATYLIHAYEEKGEDRFLRWLNGWFSGLLVDTEKGTTILFNDRFGMGRLYYHEGEDGLYFSTEAKPILSTCPNSRSIDEKGLGEFFACGCVLENRTLFKNIFTMPAASAWTFRKGKAINRRRYFDKGEWEGLPVISKEDFFSKFRETFCKILPKYFASDSQIGLSLTGGLDTRMILSCWNPSPGSLPCYTFGGPMGDIYDTKIAKEVAKACEQTHQVLRLGKEFFRNFDSLASKTVLVTDGAADICGSHEIFLNNLAKEIAPVRITGNYGGEVLRSVSTFKLARSAKSLFEEEFRVLLRRGQDLFQKLCKGNQVSFAVFKEIPWRHFGILAAAQSQVTVRSPYMDNDLVKLAYQAPAEARASNEIALRVVAETHSKLSKICTDQGVGGLEKSLSGSLRKAYYGFLFKVEYYLNDGMPNILAGASRYWPVAELERLFLGKHKFLFYRRWFGCELSEYIRSVLLDSGSAQRSFISKKAVEQIVEDHMRGKANNTEVICKLATIELVHRVLINNKL